MLEGGVRSVVTITVAAMVIIAAGLVALSLRQPSVPMYAPTPPAPREVGRALVGPVLYTVDATSSERWRHFSFRLGSVIDPAGPADWDLAFRRYQIMVNSVGNSGADFVGNGGVVDVGDVAFASVTAAPEAGYQATPAFAGWYRYGFLSHVLSPRPRVWVVRAADGRYAKMEFVSYYCPGSQPGCLTFRYVFQGDGSRRLDAR